MKRRWSLLGVALALQIACAGHAWPQAGYPAKPVRWVVPWPPGGGADTLTRLLSPKLSESLGQQIIVDNRGGAAGNIGAAADALEKGLATALKLVINFLARFLRLDGITAKIRAAINKLRDKVERCWTGWSSGSWPK